MNAIKTIIMVLFIMDFWGPLSAQVANLISNGDFSKGQSGWETKGRIVKLKNGKEDSEGNPALMIQLDNKKEQIFSQLFKLPRGSKSVKINYKIITSNDLEPSPISMNVILWGGNTSFDGLIYKEKVERLNEWQEKSASTDVITDKVGIQIKIKPGNGKIYFDDFVAEATVN